MKFPKLTSAVCVPIIFLLFPFALLGANQL